MKDVVENALKNHVFFGMTIWKGFGEGFGIVLGGRKSRFSHIFRGFFEAKIEVRYGCQKNRKNNTKPNYVEGFLGRPGGMRGLLGREKERGQKP